jgi:hypothetical protein
VSHCLGKICNHFFLTDIEISSLLFAGQDMQETTFPFYEEFVVAYAYTQNAKFVFCILMKLVFVDLQC